MDGAASARLRSSRQRDAVRSVMACTRAGGGPGPRLGSGPGFLPADFLSPGWMSSSVLQG